MAYTDPSTTVATDRAPGPGNPGRLSGNSSTPVHWKPVYDTNSPNTGPYAANIGVPPPTKGQRLTPAQLAVVKGPATGVPASWIGPQNPAGLYGSTSMNPGNVTPGVDPNQAALLQGLISAQEYQVMQQRQATANAVAEVQKARVSNLQKLESIAKTGDVTGVKALQAELNKHGYNVGVDGKFGGNTILAWNAYTKGEYADAQHQYGNAVQYASLATVRSENNQALQGKTAKERQFITSQMNAARRQVADEINQIAKAHGMVNGFDASNQLVGAEFGKDRQNVLDLQTQLNRYSEIAAQAGVIADPTQPSPTNITHTVGMDNETAHQIFQTIINGQKTALQGANQAAAKQGKPSIFDDIKGVFGTGLKFTLKDLLGPIGDALLSRGPAAYAAEELTHERGGSLLEEFQSAATSLSVIPFTHTALSEEALKLFTTFTPNHEFLGMRPNSREYQAAMDTFSAAARDQLYQNGDILRVGEVLTLETNPQFSAKHPNYEQNLFGFHGHLMPHTALSTVMDLAVGALSDPTITMAPAAEAASHIFETAADRAIAQIPARVLQDMEAAHAAAGLEGTAEDGLRAAARQQVLSSHPAARLYTNLIGRALEGVQNVSELRFALPGLPQKVAEAAMAAHDLAEGDSVAQNLAAKAVIHDALVSGVFNPKMPLLRQALALTADSLDRALGSEEAVGQLLSKVGLSRKAIQLTDRVDFLRTLSAGRGLVPTIFETRTGQFLLSAADMGARVVGKTWNAVWHESVFDHVASLSLEERFWRVADWAHNSQNVALRQAFDGLMRPFAGDQELKAAAGQILHFSPGQGVMDSFVSAFVQKEGFTEALRQAEVAMAVHTGEIGDLASQQFKTELAHWLVPAEADLTVVREAATNTGISLGKATATATTEQALAAVDKLPTDLKEHFIAVLKEGVSDAAKAGIVRDVKALLRSDSLKAEARRIIEENAARRSLALESIPERAKGLVGAGRKIAKGILSVSRVVGPDQLKLTYETENEVFHSALRAQAFNRLGNAYNLPNFAVQEFVRQAENATTEAALSQAAYGITRAAAVARGITNIDGFLAILKEAGAFTAAAGEHITSVNQITGEITKDPQVLAHFYDAVRVPSDMEMADAMRKMILSHATDASVAERLAAKLRVVVSAPGKVKIIFGKLSINDTVHAIHTAWKWLAVTNAALPLAMATAGFLKAKGGFGDRLAGAGVGLGAGLGMFGVRSVFRVTFNESFVRRALSEGYLTEVSIPGWSKIKSHFGDMRGFFNRRVLSENLVMQGQEATDVFFSNHLIATVDPGWETIDIAKEKGSTKAVDGFDRIVNKQLNPESDPVVAIGLREKGGHLTSEMLAAEEAAGRNAERLGPRLASWQEADRLEREANAAVVRPDTTFVPNPGVAATPEEPVVSPLQAASDAAHDYVSGGGKVITPPTNAELLDQHYPGAPTAKFYRGEPGYTANAARGTDFWIPEEYNNGGGLAYAKDIAGPGGRVYEVDLPVGADGKALVGERAPSGTLGWDLNSAPEFADAARDIAAPVTEGAPDPLSQLEKMLGDTPQPEAAVAMVQKSVVQDAVDRGIITAGEAQDPTIVSRVLAEHYATGEVSDAYRDTLRNILDNAGTATERQAARVATQAAIETRTRQYADALIAQFFDTEEGKIWLARWRSIGVSGEDAVARMREFIDRYTTPEIASIRVGGGFGNAPREVDEATLKRTLETPGKGPDYLHVQKTNFPQKFSDVMKAYKKATLKATLTWPDNMLNRRPWQRVLFNQEYDRLIKNGVDAVEAQQIADQFATERVNSIAHRYAEQSIFAHKADIFAPFTHARFDLVRAYSRLLVDHPIQIMSIGRHAAELFNAGEQAGIFQKNQFTGEWQMTVPGSGWLSKALMGTSFEIPFTANIKDAFFVTGGAFNIGPIPQFGGPLWEGLGVALNKIDPSLFEGDSAIHKVFFPYGPNGKILPNKAPNLMWMAMTGDVPPWEKLDQSHWHNEMNRWQDAIGREMISQHRTDNPGDLNWMPDPKTVEDATRKFFMAWSIFNSTVPATTYPVFATQQRFESAINDFTLGGKIPFTGDQISEFISRYPEFEPYVSGATTKYVGPEDLSTLQRLGVGTPYNRFSTYDPGSGTWKSTSGAAFDPNTGEYLGASGEGENYQRESQLGYRVSLSWSDWVQQFKEAQRTSTYFTAVKQINLEPDPAAREAAMTKLNVNFADVVQKNTHDGLIEQELWIIKNRYGSKQMQQDGIARVKSQFGLSAHDLLKYQTKINGPDYHIDPWLGARDGVDIAAAVDKYVADNGGNSQGADMRRAAYVATLSPAEQVTYWDHMKNNVANDPSLEDATSVMKKYDYYNGQAFTASSQAPWLFRKNLSPTTGSSDYTGDNNPWKDKIDAEKTDIQKEMNNAYTQVDLIGYQMQVLANAKNWKAYYALKDKQTLTYSLINTLRDSLFNNVPDMSKYYDDLHAAHLSTIIGNVSMAKRYQQQALIDAAAAPMYVTSAQQRYLHMPTSVQEAYLTDLVDHLDQPVAPKAKGADYAKEAELKKWLSTTYGAKKVFWEWLTPYQQTLLQAHFPSQVAAWQLESDTQLHGAGAGSGAGKYKGANKSIIAELTAISDLLRMYDQRTGDAPAAYQQFMQLPGNAQVKSQFLKNHPEVAAWIKNGPLANMPVLYRELTIGGLIKFGDPNAEAAFKKRYGKGGRGSRFNPNLFAQSGNFKGVKWNKLPLNLQWAIEQLKVWSQRPKDAKGKTIGAPSTYDLWLNMPSGQDKAQYLQSHQEVQDWIKQGPMQNMPDAYKAVVRDIMQRYGEWTASQDPLGKTLSAFFALPGYARDQFMQQHPELEVYFATTRTPQQQAMQNLTDTYFKIQDQGARKAYLAAHPELQQHFLDARQQRYERFLNQVAVYMGANPGMFTDYLNKQQAVLGELLRKFSEPFLIRETTSANPIDEGPGQPRRAYREPGSRVRARAGG